MENKEFFPVEHVFFPCHTLRFVNGPWFTGLAPTIFDGSLVLSEAFPEHQPLFSSDLRRRSPPFGAKVVICFKTVLTGPPPLPLRAPPPPRALANFSSLIQVDPPSGGSDPFWPLRLTPPSRPAPFSDFSQRTRVYFSFGITRSNGRCLFFSQVPPNALCPLPAQKIPSRLPYPPLLSMETGFPRPHQPTLFKCANSSPLTQIMRLLGSAPLPARFFFPFSQRRAVSQPVLCL